MSNKKLIERLEDSIRYKTHEEVTALLSEAAEALKEAANDQEFLNCLQAGGVDNWDFYGDAQEMYNPPYPDLD